MGAYQINRAKRNAAFTAKLDDCIGKNFAQNEIVVAYIV
jgi:hypothetical protein